MNKKVDSFIDRAKGWKLETQALRQVLLDCNLEEDLKWGKPCYSSENKNIVIIQGFKEYLAILFFKGVLIKDPKEYLVKTGENTHVGRQFRFSGLEEIKEKEIIIKEFVKQAIEIERLGLKTESVPKPELVFPIEFQNKLEENQALKTAFAKLTPGRKRGYHIYFTSAKQVKTREARIEKYIPSILEGKGIND